jgi:hypothetical protein
MNSYGFNRRSDEEEPLLPNARGTGPVSPSTSSARYTTRLTSMYVASKECVGHGSPENPNMLVPNSVSMSKGKDKKRCRPLALPFVSVVAAVDVSGSSTGTVPIGKQTHSAVLLSYLG